MSALALPFRHCVVLSGRLAMEHFPDGQERDVSGAGAANLRAYCILHRVPVVRLVVDSLPIPVFAEKVPVRVKGGARRAIVWSHKEDCIVGRY